MNRAIPLQTAPESTPGVAGAALRLVGRAAGKSGLHALTTQTTPCSCAYRQTSLETRCRFWPPLSTSSLLNKNKESLHVWHSLHSGYSQ